MSRMLKKIFAKETEILGAMTTQSDCWKYDIDRCCWRKMIFRKLFSQPKRCSSQLGKGLKSPKTSLGQKLRSGQCDHVERRNLGSEKYQSVLPGLKTMRVRNEEIGDNRKMKPWQFHFGQKLCS